MEKNRKNLSIKNKIILIILFCSVFFSISVYFFSTNFLLDRFLLLENDQVVRNLDRVDFFLKSSGNNQLIKIQDWALWDDTYEFINDKNEEYIKSNLTDETLLALKINTIVFVNNENEIVYSKFLDLNLKSELPDKNLNSYLNTNMNYLKNLQQGKDNFNIIKIPEGDMIVSSANILKSDGSGPSRGTIFFGTFLGQEIIKNISEFTRFPVGIYPYDNKDNEPDTILAKNGLSSSGQYFIESISNNFVHGHSLIYDIYDKPISIIKVEIPRDIYNQGKAMTNLLLVIIISSFFLIGIIIILLIKYFIINRLVILEDKVSSISDSNDFDKINIKDEHDDEIGSIASVINKMFIRIKDSQNKERSLVKSENLASEKIRERMEEIDKLNKLMVGRELKMIELKDEIKKLKEEKGEHIIS